MRKAMAVVAGVLLVVLGSWAAAAALRPPARVAELGPGVVMEVPALTSPPEASPAPRPTPSRTGVGVVPAPDPAPAGGRADDRRGGGDDDEAGDDDDEAGDDDDD